MPQDNVEIVRQMNRAFNRGDDTWIDFYAPEIEYVMPPEWPEDPVYIGHDGLRALGDALRTVFGAQEWRVDQLIDAGEERVVVLAHLHGRLEGGQDLQQRIAAVCYFDAGRIVRQVSYLSWDDALEAAGVAQ